MNGIVNLVEVVGAYALLGFSGVGLEKEGKARLSAWDCVGDSETKESDAQRRRDSLVGFT